MLFELPGCTADEYCQKITKVQQNVPDLPTEHIVWGFKCTKALLPLWQIAKFVDFKTKKNMNIALIRLEL